MTGKLKNILLIVFSSASVFGFLVLFIIFPNTSYSFSERRSLAQKPDITEESIASGSYMEDFESYTLDQFPFRDTFRKTKALSSKYIFLKKDNNGLYTSNGHISKMEYPLNEQKLDRNINKITEIFNSYLSGTDCDIYFSVIPDKNYFLAPIGGYLLLDYKALSEKIESELDFGEYIDIFSSLSIDDYYKTDPHWKQEKILPTAKLLGEKMDIKINDIFTEKETDFPFYGAYYGQSALDFEPDTLKYLTNDTIESCTVTSYNSGSPVIVPFYDMEKANGKDPYEMYLNGSDALLTIENPNAETDRELILFRDSFGSSIAPLLVSGYSKITLIDLRYIKSDLIKNFVSFKNQDVLFLYSTLVLNNTISQ